MRTNAVVLSALTVVLAFPSESSAQRRFPIPRVGSRPPEAQPAPLPPQAPAVNRALAFRRSRWSVEGYPFVSQLQLPAATGDNTTLTTIGTGSRGDYRITDRFSATLDLTSSLPLTQTITGSAEVGARFRPMPWGESVRPFFDVRAAYSYLSDMYAMPGSPFALSGNDPSLTYFDAGRRSRGFGGVAGAGFEYSLTRSIALTTELTATRARMTTYRLIGAPTLPNDRSYWMTMTRWSLGLKFNPVHALHLAQNPRS